MTTSTPHDRDSGQGSTPPPGRPGRVSDPDFRRPSAPAGCDPGTHRGSGGCPIQVQEVMTRQVEAAQSDDSLQTAAARMRDLDVGLLPVFDGGRLVGMLTDRDITVRAVAAGRDPTRTRVGEVMTAHVDTCFLDEDVTAAAQLMRDRQVRRLAVLDRAGQLAGILSLGDLAVAGGDDRLSGETLERISEPTAPGGG